jgi:hypothetical protein
MSLGKRVARWVDRKRQRGVEVVRRRYGMTRAFARKLCRTMSGKKKWRLGLASGKAALRRSVWAAQKDAAWQAKRDRLNRKIDRALRQRDELYRLIQQREASCE